VVAIFHFRKGGLTGKEEEERGATLKGVSGLSGGECPGERSRV